MSVREILLQAAAGLGASFTAEELLIAAWTRDRKAIGLPGFEEKHPDIRKVASFLYGGKSLLIKGKFYRQPDGKLSLVPEATLAEPPEPRERRLTARLAAMLEKAKTSLAYKLFNEGKKESIHYGLALSFWSSTGSAEQVEQFASLMRTDTPEDRALTAAHNWLFEKFGKHLKKKEA